MTGRWRTLAGRGHPYGQWRKFARWRDMVFSHRPAWCFYAYTRIARIGTSLLLCSRAPDRRSQHRRTRYDRTPHFTSHLTDCKTFNQSMVCIS